MIGEQIGSSRWLIADNRIGEWVMRRLPLYDPSESWGPFSALGVFDGHDILAGMVVYGLSKRKGNAHIAMASDTARWATRDTIAALLRYPFGQLGINRLTTYTAASNDRALRMNRLLGFKQEGVLRQAYGEDDCIVMGLLRAEMAPWLKQRIP